MQLQVKDTVTFMYSVFHKPRDGVIYKLTPTKVGIKSNGSYYNIDRSCILGVVLNGFLEPL